MVTKDYANRIEATKEATKNGFIFNLLKWLLIALVVLFALVLITGPVRKNWSNDYLARGQSYLDQKKYLSAELEFQKSLLLYSGNADARTDLDLAKNAEGDVSALRDYYRARNIQAEIDAFAQAKAVPATPAEAVKTAKDLIESGEYQLALIPAKTATEMDTNYQSGWQYLGIAALYSGQRVEISAEAKKIYLDQVATAKSHLREVPDVLK